MVMENKSEEFETELNLDFSKYARHFIANEERYTEEEGFFFYQIQNGLEETPRASEVYEDLELMAEYDILERETIGNVSKKPNTRYRLKSDEELTKVEEYARNTRDWVESYTESLRQVIPAAEEKEEQILLR